MFFLALMALAWSAAALPGGNPATSAAERPTAGQDRAPDQDDQHFLRSTEALMKGQFEVALRLAEQIPPAQDKPAANAIVAALKASALFGLKRDVEAHKLVADAERRAPQDPGAAQLLFLGALLTRREDVAADAIDKLIARFPDLVREVDQSQMTMFLQSEPKGQDRRNEDRRIALARLGYGGDSDYGYYIASSAVKFLVKRQDFRGASELLPYIKAPQSYENMLVQRRFAALWPQLEALAGPELSTVRAASVVAAERAYSQAPADPEKLQIYANALRHAGRLSEAIALRPKLPASSADMASATEQMGWAVNNVALAMSEAGQHEQADRLFEMLNSAAAEAGFWLVSMKINRLGLLVERGQFEKALMLLDTTEKSAADGGTPYAQQLVRAATYCTYSRLGRTTDAARLRPAVIKHGSDARGSTVDALVCAGELDEAEKLTLAGLDDEDAQEDFLRRLQRSPLTSDVPTVWADGWAALRRRPAVERKFAAVGRDLPDHLRAPAAKK